MSLLFPIKRLKDVKRFSIKVILIQKIISFVNRGIFYENFVFYSIPPLYFLVITVQTENRMYSKYSLYLYIYIFCVYIDYSVYRVF